MPTEDSSLEDATEVPKSEEPHDDGKPVDSDKPSDGTETQEHADATKPADEQDPPILADILGESAEPKRDDPPKDAPQAEQQPPQDLEQKPPATEQPKADKPVSDDGKKPLTPDEIKSTPKFARNRIKNLERDLEAATAPVRELEARAISAGYEKADEVLEAVETYGMALKKRDPSAIAALHAKLVEAGLKQEPQQVAIPAAKVRELLKSYAYDELEALAAAADKAAPATSEPPKPPAKPEQVADQQRAQRQQVDPEVATAIGELRAMANDIRSQHGEHADEILAEIKAEVDKVDAASQKRSKHGLHHSVWADEFRAARDAVIARRRDLSRRVPPRTLRPSTSSATRNGTSLTDELLGG